MTGPEMGDRSLTPAQIEQFIAQGFVRIDDAFSPALAEEARAILWRDLPGTPEDPSSWTQPVVRLGMYAAAPFRAAANTPVLHAAFDQLVGPGRWRPCEAMGTFPVRFPWAGDPGDAGWHVDMSFGLESPDFMDWRINLRSKGRSLLMLFLFSDVGEDDAPTRLRAGSHRRIAWRLAPAGEAGLSLRDLAATGFAESADCPEVQATGPGTVFLCHPFLVHAAQPHQGSTPRFLAQPPLLPAAPFRLEGEGLFPVEYAIRLAVQESR